MANGEHKAEPADRLRRVATEVALRTGLLKKCAVHDEVYDPGQHDFQGACMVATFLVNTSDPLVASFAGDRVALTILLKSICQGYHPACQRCTG